MTREFGKGIFSRKLKVFILLWIFLHNIVTYFGGSLLLIYYQKAEFHTNNFKFFLSTPDYWIGGGGILGAVITVILYRGINIRNHFCVIRCFQLISIGVIFGYYKLQYDWPEKYWIMGLYSTFLLQGAAECMSQILAPMYIMETVCDRDLDESVAFLLLVTTQIPIHISSFAALLLSGNHLFLTLGVGIFGGIFFLVFVFYIFLPKSTKDGIEHDRNEYVEYWHLQFEGEFGCLRPAMSSVALCLLSQLLGYQAYQFYGPWSLRVANIPIDSKLITSGLAFFTLLIVLLFWTKKRLPYFLVIPTAMLSVCLFLSGILLYALESGGIIFVYAPLSIYMAFICSYTAGIGSLDKIVPVLITPRQYRLTVLTLSVVASIITQRLARAVIPTLIDWLHPFGLFWLHSGIVLLGLLYITVGVVGQTSSRTQGVNPGRRTVQEFITQV